MGQKKRRRKWAIITTFGIDPALAMPQDALEFLVTGHTLRSPNPVTVMHTADRADRCLVCNGQGAVG